VFLPQGRDQMVRGPKRQFHSPPYPAAQAQELAARKGTDIVELIPPQPDGIGATRILMPPGGEAVAPTPAGGSGQFVMVMAGSLLHEGRTFTRWEPIFLSPEEAPLPLRAGPGGADVLSLRLAAKAPEYVKPD
jgi:hypothetical protein